MGKITEGAWVSLFQSKPSEFQAHTHTCTLSFTLPCYESLCHSNIKERDGRQSRCSFSGGYEARRSSVQCGALDYTDGQPSSQRVLHFGNEGPLVLEERRALHSFFSVGPWRPHEKCLFGFSLLETK